MTARCSKYLNILSEVVIIQIPSISMPRLGVLHTIPLKHHGDTKEKVVRVYVSDLIIDGTVSTELIIPTQRRKMG